MPESPPLTKLNCKEKFTIKYPKKGPKMLQKHVKTPKKHVKIALLGVLLLCFSNGIVLEEAWAVPKSPIPPPPVLSSRADVKTDADWQKLSQGNVVITDLTKQSADHVPMVEARILVPRSIDVVREAVSNPQKILRNERKVKSLRLLSKSGNTQLLEYTVMLGRMLPTFDYVLRHQQVSPNVVQFQRVSGSFRDIAGLWQVTPVDDSRTILTYRLRLDPGPGLPGFLIASFSKADLPQMMQNARAAVLAE